MNPTHSAASPHRRFRLARNTLIVAGTALSGVTFLGTAPRALAVDTPIEVTATSLDFGELVIGDSMTYDVSYYNPTDDPIAILKGIGGSLDVPFYAAGGCGGMILEPLDACIAEYTFVPTTVGTFTDTVWYTLSTDHGDEDFYITVTGTGIPATAGPEALQPSATGVWFGDVQLGSTGTAEITYTNTADVPIGPIKGIGGGSLEAPFNSNHDCGSGTILQPGESCTRYLSFSPEAYGTYSATSIMTLSTPDGDADFPVSLTGFGKLVVGPQPPPPVMQPTVDVDPGVEQHVAGASDDVSDAGQENDAATGADTAAASVEGSPSAASASQPVLAGQLPETR